ncbi:MAG TPA: DsbA family protein [Roseiflexaceae bacterium]|nr:DsbA family protein [Roseiflexaceae bacterium]
MTTRSQRGRAVQKKPNNTLRTLYIIIGVVAVVALAALGISALQGGQAAEVPAGTLPVKPASSAPTGRTAEGYYFKGQENAPVTVTEYADFQCPGCGYYANAVAAAFDKEYVESGKVKFVYHEYPLNGHPNAVPAAEAARCAGDQGAFWKMHDMLFTNQRQWSPLPRPQDQFAGYAGQLGLDKAAFQQCMADGTHREAVRAAQRAAESLGLTGTPSFAVNGTVVDTTGAQSVDDIVTRMRVAVEQALASQ